MINTYLCVYMNNGNYSGSPYTREIIEFVAIGVKFAQVLEQGGERMSYIKQLLECMPRLYSQTLSLPNYFYDTEEDFIEEYITEGAYEAVRLKAERLLGEDDQYLSTMSADMQYSDTPIASRISEQLADIYQHVGNLLGIIKEMNEMALPSAIGRCLLYWREHWGGVLLSALGGLHSIYIRLAEDDPFEGEADSILEEDE